MNFQVRRAHLKVENETLLCSLVNTDCNGLLSSHSTQAPKLISAANISPSKFSLHVTKRGTETT